MEQSNGQQERYPGRVHCIPLAHNEGQYWTVQCVLTRFCAAHDLEIKSEAFLTCQSNFSPLFNQFAHSNYESVIIMTHRLICSPVQTVALKETASIML